MGVCNRMYAEYLSSLSTYLPLFNPGGDVSAIEETAGTRISMFKELGKLETEMGRVNFTSCQGEVYDAMRNHSARLKRSIDSCGEAQRSLGKKIERYAGHLDNLKIRLNSLRGEAEEIHPRHQRCVTTYNNAVDHFYRSGRTAAARVEVDYAKSDLESAQRDWAEVIEEANKERREFVEDVDRIASDMKAGSRPNQPLSFEKPEKVTTCTLNHEGAAASLDGIICTEDGLKTEIQRIEALEGQDRIRGHVVFDALSEMDDEWKPYFEFLSAAVAEFLEQASRFTSEVKTVDEANKFDFDSMKMDDPESFLRFVEKHKSTLSTATLAAADAAFGLAEASAIVEKAPPGLANDFAKSGAAKWAARSGGWATTGGSGALDYLFSREEGYSPRTSAGAAVAGTAASVTVGILLAGFVSMTPVGIVALVGITGLSAVTGMATSSGYKAVAGY